MRNLNGWVVWRIVLHRGFFLWVPRIFHIFPVLWCLSSLFFFFLSNFLCSTWYQSTFKSILFVLLVSPLVLLPPTCICIVVALMPHCPYSAVALMPCTMLRPYFIIVLMSPGAALILSLPWCHVPHAVPIHMPCATLVLLSSCAAVTTIGRRSVLIFNAICCHFLVISGLLLRLLLLTHW